MNGEVVSRIPWFTPAANPRFDRLRTSLACGYRATAMVALSSLVSPLKMFAREFERHKLMPLLRLSCRVQPVIRHRVITGVAGKIRASLGPSPIHFTAAFQV